MINNSKKWLLFLALGSAILLILAVLVVNFSLTETEAFNPGLRAKSKSERLERPTNVVAVGDIMLSRTVGQKIEQADDINLPFLQTAELLTAADITFGNLECPLDPNPLPIDAGLVFRCPAKYVKGVKNAGFDILSTANNHTFDQGEENIAFTIDELLKANILPVGTGKTFAEVRSGKIITKNDTKFGFLAYSYSARNDRGSTHPSVATWHDDEQARQDIQTLKERADVVIVSLHAGIEYTRRPHQTQIDFAHQAIDFGADIIIGHHPHWIQTIETYKGKPIFYSLGNFVFDQEWSQETKEGLVVQLTFNNSQLTEAKLIPVIVENFCCPRHASEEELNKILSSLDLASDTIRFNDN